MSDLKSSTHPPIEETAGPTKAVRLGIALDWWAVVIAILLAIAVRLGLKIPW